MPDITVVLALDPPSLARVAEHLLRPRHGARVLERAREASALRGLLERTRPDVLVANPRFLGRESVSALAELRRSSPGSKIVLVLPEVRGAAKFGPADGLVEEDTLVDRLLPLLRSLAAGEGSPGTASGNPRRKPKPKEPETR